MCDFSKKVLTYGLYAYLVILFFDVLHVFIKDLPLYFTGFWFSISSLILFAYVYDKGKTDIGKYGVMAIVADTVIDIVYNIFISISCYSSFCTGISKLFRITSYLTSNAVSILAILALFSLIKSNNQKVDQFKKVTIILAAVFAVYQVIVAIFSFTQSDFMMNLFAAVSSLKNGFEYIVIVIYLLSKTSGQTVNINTTQVNQPVQNQMQQTVNQVNNVINQVGQTPQVTTAYQQPQNTFNQQ